MRDPEAVPDGPRRRLRVLVLIRTTGGGQGGAENVALELLRSLDRERFDPTLCVARRPEPDNTASLELIDRLRAEGQRVVVLDRRTKLGLRGWVSLGRMLRRERIDVLHAHLFGTTVWASVIGWLARVPVIVTHEHGWEFSGRPLRVLLDRHVVARLSDAMLVVSDIERDKTVRIERVPPERVHVLPNAIHALPRADPATVRGELGIAPGTPVVGTVCVLRPEKAIDLLIDAMARVVETVPSARLLIAGDGEERERLEQAAAGSAAAGAITFLGRRSDVPAVLAALDVAVICSDREAIPLAVLEYMDTGKAIVGTAVGGIPALLDDGETGLLVPPRDPDALAAAITRLLGDPDLARRLGRAAQERRAGHYDVAAVVAGLQDLYTDLWSVSRRRRD